MTGDGAMYYRRDSDNTTVAHNPYVVAEVACLHYHHLLPALGYGGCRWDPPGWILRKADNFICGYDADTDRLWVSTAADIS